MLLRHRNAFCAHKRSGKAGLTLLLALPSMLLAMALAFYAAELVETRTLLRNATDAAALAGVQTFVNDDLLRGNPTTMQTLIPQARQMAQQYAALNLVFGDSLPLDLNNSNDQDGDVVLGTLVYPRSKEFILPNLNSPPNPEWLTINTVRVTGHRSVERGNPVGLHNGPLLARMPNDAVAVSTATLDRYVIGFRPMGHQPMPLSPLGIFSHQPGKLRHCWEYNVERRRGRDQFKAVPNGPLHQIVQGADGLHEMEVFLGGNQQLGEMMKASKTSLNTMLQQGKFNCCLLHFGSSQVRDLARQLVNGVTDANLSPFGGQLVLGPGNQLEVGGTPWGPTNESEEGKLLQYALKQLQSTGESRLWPCFSSFDTESNNPVLCGFVAARVVQVKENSGKGKGITFSIQPCMTSTATAVTDATRCGIGTAKLPNPYVCKVRLVE